MTKLNYTVSKTTYFIGIILSCLEILGIIPLFALLEELNNKKYKYLYDEMTFDLSYEAIILCFCIFFIISSILVQYYSNRYLFRKCWDIYPKLVTDLSCDIVASKIDLTNKEKFLKLIITETQQYVFSVILSRLIILSKLALIIFAIIILFIVAPKYTFYSICVFLVIGFIVLPVYLRTQKEIGISREQSYRILFENVGHIIGLRDEIYLKFLNQDLMEKITHSSMRFAYMSARNSYNPQTLRVILEGALMCGILLIAYTIFKNPNIMSSLGDEILFAALALKLLPALQSVLKALGEKRSGRQSEVVILELLNSCRTTIYFSTIQEGSLHDKIDVVYELPNTRREKQFSLLTNKLNVVIGQSGTGKTTFLRALAGLSDNASGSLSTGGKKYDFPIDWRGLRITFVPQKPHFSYDQAEFSNLSNASTVGELIKDVQHPDLGVSGGENQRYSLSRALQHSDNALIILDEPTSAIDDTNFALFACVLRNSISNGATVVAVTHDERLMNIGDVLINFDEE